MFIFNVHGPNKTFALAAKDQESCSALIDRIIEKAALSPSLANSVRTRKDGAGVVYEFNGDRWALEDDDDLAIVLDRFQGSTPTITLHIVTPIAHARTGGSHASPAPPAYSSASGQIQARAQAKSRSINGEMAKTIQMDSLTACSSLAIPNAVKSEARSVRSARSTRSRKSKWGDDDAEPLGDVKRRAWNEFHAGNGVRTVIGKVGNVDNVRMLLKSGYRKVYISRAFAARHGLIQPKHAPGSAGYSGLQILGNVPITIGSRTAVHPAMLSEEQHFDVVLGRSWIEKMNVKVDPLDQTSLTYMDSGEEIPCDLVVLRDAKGEIITIT